MKKSSKTFSVEWKVIKSRHLRNIYPEKFRLAASNRLRSKYKKSVFLFVI